MLQHFRLAAHTTVHCSPRCTAQHPNGPDLRAVQAEALEMIQAFICLVGRSVTM
jgi:hypothetical protein